MHKLIVYSCITGGFDDVTWFLGSKPVPDDRVLWLLFCDQDVPSVRLAESSVPWQVRKLEFWHPTSSRRSSRFHKLNSHLVLPAHEMSCWVDGNAQIKHGTNMMDFAVRSLATADLATFKHPLRRCVYEEHLACLNYRKDDPQTMAAQIERYRSEGYPAFSGMIESCCLLRRDTDAIRRFNAAWWDELVQGSLRDQLSFNYVARKHVLEYAIIPGHRERSPYFVFRHHRHTQ